MQTTVPRVSPRCWKPVHWFDDPCDTFSSHFVHFVSSGRKIETKKLKMSLFTAFYVDF
jgi:hypothetical protein